MHCAPGFGEDDYKVCLEKGLIQQGGAPVPIDIDGRFTSTVGDFEGLYIKEADEKIMERLKAMKRLVVKG